MKLFYFLFALFLILAFQCGQTIPERHYYVIDYVSREIDSSSLPCTTLTLPLPYEVRMTPLSIPRIYDRRNITVRFSPYELNYYRYHLWALRPDENITDLIMRHLEKAKIYERVARDYYQSMPDYEIKGDIISIEQYYHKSEKVSHYSAHLNMKLELYEKDKAYPVITHTIDREERLYHEDMKYFVLALSDIIREETDLFINKIMKFHCGNSVKTDSGTR